MFLNCDTTQFWCYPKRKKKLKFQNWKCIVTSFYSLQLLLLVIYPPILKEFKKKKGINFSFLDRTKKNITSHGPKWRECLSWFTKIKPNWNISNECKKKYSDWIHIDRWQRNYNYCKWNEKFINECDLSYSQHSQQEERRKKRNKEKLRT